MRTVFIPDFCLFYGECFSLLWGVFLPPMWSVSPSYRECFSLLSGVFLPPEYYLGKTSNDLVMTCADCVYILSIFVANLNMRKKYVRANKF